jgi:hypothetical protein
MIRPRKLFTILIFSILAAFIVTQAGLGECYGLPSPDEGEERIFAQSACAGVSNDPPNPTVFTIDEQRTITKIGTYHWNDASGESPGTIGLRDEQGKTYGPWQADGEPGQGGVPNAYWIVQLSPSVDLPAGTYTIIDSSPSTWSYTYESNDCGLASVIGLKGGSGGSEKGKSAPCAGDGVYYSPRSPTDLYTAGPGLAPGMYNIWYGKRTGTQIGTPDKWNQLGQKELFSGKFYVFDVTTANLGEATPQMINPMLTNPAPGRSLVWLKLSSEDAYVVCFDGPLDGGLQLAGAWKMSGHQEGFNDWKADLNLKKDGTLEWTETEGANVGANRQGTWQFDGMVLTLKWVSPGGGQTSWVSRSVAENSISSGTYSVERAPGGTWSAMRVAEGI